MEKKNELSVLMSEDMLPVEHGSNGLTVNSRDLYNRLCVGRDYSTWIRERIKEYGFEEGVDFSPVLGKINSVAKAPRGRKRIDYIITLDMAKELAMVERNEKGRLVRKYFLEVEKRYRDWIGFVLPRLDQDVDLFGVRLGYNYVQLLGAVGLSLKSGSVNGRRRRHPSEFWKNQRGVWFVSEDFGKTIIAWAAARRLSYDIRHRSLEQRI